MRVLRCWDDDDTMAAALFDDGHRLIMSEKSAALISPTGQLVEQFWKEEPTGPHYDCWLKERPPAQRLDAVLSGLIFEIGHHHRSWPGQAGQIKLLLEATTETK